MPLCVVLGVATNKTRHGDKKRLATSSSSISGLMRTDRWTKEEMGMTTTHRWIRKRKIVTVI